MYPENHTGLLAASWRVQVPCDSNLDSHLSTPWVTVSEGQFEIKMGKVRHHTHLLVQCIRGNRYYWVHICF